MKNVVIVTTSWCGYCRAAKQLLSKLGVDFEDVDVTSDEAKRAEYSKQAGGHSTVPMIFIGDVFIGGFTELASLHQSGSLQPMLED